MIFETSSPRILYRYSAAATVIIFILAQGWMQYRGLFRQPVEQVFGNGVSQHRYDFALKVKNTVEKDALILYDPMSDAQNYFRIYGERSSLVSWKIVPTSDAEILEWVERLMALNCVYLNENGEYVKDRSGFKEMDAGDIVQVAEHYGVDYIIATQDDSARFVEVGLKEILADADDGYVMFSVER